MKHLDGVEPSIAQRRDPIVNPGSSWMSKRYQPTRAMNDPDHLFRRCTGAFDEGGTPLPEPPVKCFTGCRDIPGLDHRAREPRPADRLAAPALCFLEHGLNIDRHSE